MASIAGRVTDVSQLAVDDIKIGEPSPQDVTLNFVRGKGASRQHDALSVPTRLQKAHLALLKRHYEARLKKREPWLFADPDPNSAEHRKFTERALIMLRRANPAVRASSVRCMGAQKLADMGLDMEKIMAVTGHKSKQSAALYLQHKTAHSNELRECGARILPTGAPSSSQ
jgi:hypothetical protein